MMQFKDWVQTQRTEEWDLDEATVNLLIDRFYWREICDDERMERYWNRTLANVRDRYKNILRIETIKFDPLVSKYFEGEYTYQGSNNDSSSRVSRNTNTHSLGETARTTFETEMNSTLSGENGSITDGTNVQNGTKTGSNHVVNSSNSSYNDTKNINGTNQGSSVVTSQTTENVQNETDSNDSVATVELNKRASKAAPMNASGIQLETRGTEPDAELDGMLGDLDFEYASSYEQADKESKSQTAHHEEGSSSTTGSGNSTTRDNYSNSGREAIVGSKTGNDSSDSNLTEGTSNNGSNHEVVSGDFSNSGKDWGNNETYTVKGGQNIDALNGTDNITKYANNSSVKRDRFTGRDGVLPQDAMKKAIDFLESYSNAFEWLCNKLEINFIGIYDI